MKSNEVSEVKIVIQQAVLAAQLATVKMIDENPDTWYPCGFAWVIIKPARGPFVKALKEMNIGSTSSEGGYMVYNPSNIPTQWMDAKIAGASAFAEVLRANGITCGVRSRMD